MLGLRSRCIYGLALWFFLPSLAAEANQATFQRWRSQDVTWIRVGLASTKPHIKLKSSETLLVLDGDRVVSTFEPGGTFYITASAQSGGLTRYWVQIQAAADRSVLEASQTKLKASHQDLSFQIKTAKQLNTLRTGPFQDKSSAESAKRHMIQAGYKDAFLVRGKSSYQFQWVTDNFDKFELPSLNLGLVRMDPSDSIGFGEYRYRGILRFRLSKGKLRVINELPLETYLRGVVPTELGPHAFPEVEALKAQAVAARTYAIKNMGRFSRRGYDICDSPACQAYSGVSKEHPLSDRAIRETADRVIYHGDELIDALYTSTCGGVTDDVANVFPGRKEPYLKSKSSYLAEYKQWNLPLRESAFIPKRPDDQNIAAKALVYGMNHPPQLDGNLTRTSFQTLCADFSWIMGRPERWPTNESISVRNFWETLASLPFVKRTIEHQITAQDRRRLVAGKGLADEQTGFASFLLRFHLLAADQLGQLNDDEPITRRAALLHLLNFLETFGPKLEWLRYRLEDVRGNTVTLSRGMTNRTVNLKTIAYYLHRYEDQYGFVSQPTLEELDRVYIPKKPFSPRVIRLEPVGDVASVDRFSVFNTWLEKKDMKTIQSRARRYLKVIGKIQDITIVSRAPSGRVTQVDFSTDKGVFTATGLNIRWSLGIRDNLSDMLPIYRNDALVSVTFSGRGWGHGIGMSQVGAYGLARMGWNYEQILTHYYDGVQVKPFQTKPKRGAANQTKQGGG